MPQIIEVPGFGQVEFPDGMTDEQIVAAIRANSGSGRDFKAENPAEYDSASPEFQAKYGAERPGVAIQAAGNLARMGAQGLAALPLAAADAGVAVRNMFQPKPAPTMAGLITGQQPQQDQYELPSDMWRRSLDALIPAPQGLIGQGGEILGAAVIGGRLPVPGAKAQVPPGSQQAISPAVANLQKARAAGYVVPPATSNPTAVTKILEGIAGKLTTAQSASAKNQVVTNNLAKRAIGLPEDAPLTLDSIKAVRQEAGKAFEAVRTAGRITSDNKYRVDLVNMASRYKKAAEDFPELAKNDVEEIFKGLNKESFDADSAVDMIAILRDNADDAFRTGKSQVGKAYREASRILEGAIERHLAKGGKDSAAMLREFRAARQAMAKTYTVEKAFNASTGNVSATKLGQQLAKGKPLSGELRAAGQFSQAFPKASREFNESLPGISPLDFYASGGVSALSQQPWYLLYPFARQATRNALLSQFGQRLAVPSGPRVPSNQLAGSTANALALLGQQ